MHECSEFVVILLKKFENLFEFVEKRAEFVGICCDFKIPLKFASEIQP